MQKGILAGISAIAFAGATAATAQTTPLSAQGQSLDTRDSSASPKTNAGTAAIDKAQGSDEIIVTATKREQTLQNVPVSVSVTSEQTIQRAQIRDLNDLQSVVPSLKVDQQATTGQTNFIIRGFGNGSGNVGIEGSVGVFIDGVYRSRSASSLNDLPEIERIEVLRGPQSTLFGKNVSAGAINIVTKRPEFDFGGRVDLTVGNYGQMVLKADATGPISDTIAVRISGNVNERDGFLHNPVTGVDDNNRDRGTVRGDILWKPSSKVSVRIIADYNSITERCCGIVQLANGPTTQFIGAPIPFGLGAAIPNPATKFNGDNVENQDPTNHIVGKGISGQIDYDAGFAKLTSITSYRNQLDHASQDIDDTGANISSDTENTRIKTFTQEVRLASTGSGPLTWLIGGFYDHEHIDTSDSIKFGSDARAFADGLSGQVPAAFSAVLPALAGHSNLYALELIQSLVTPSIHPGSTYFQAGQGVYAPFTLKQDSFSIFGQADYHITSRLTVTGGVSYLNDRKASTANVQLNDPFSALNFQNIPQFTALGLPGNLYSALNALQFFYANAPTHGPVNYPNANESGILKGDKVTYLGRAAYDFGFLNAYASYSTGWKAGAYNLSIDARAPDANGIGRSAGPENVTLYELGLKAKFHGGFFNLAVFKQAIRGFQDNAFTGTGFSLVNAGKESAKGIEIDSAYRPLSWLSLTASATYLDPKYNSFLRAPCVTFDTANCAVNPATGVAPLFRDLSGTRPADISKWTTSASATISRDLGHGYSAFLRGEYDYASKTQLSETLPAYLDKYGTSDINASLGFANSPLKLEILFFVRNAANHRTVTGAFATVAQAGSYSGYLNDPRTYGATLTKRF